MTITVVSQENPEPVQVPAVPAKTEPEKESPEKSAPAAEPEQNEASESETEELAAKQDESEGDSESEGGEEKPEEDSEKEKPKKKGGFQRRIDKLNSQKAEAQRELEYWRNLALKGQEKSPEQKTPTVEKPKAAEGKPNPDDFDSHTEYVEALTDWKTEQKFKAKEQEARMSQIQKDHESKLKSHFDRVKSFAEKTTDFQEVVEGVDDIQPSAAVEEAILSSDKGPELIYELAKNREEYERICKLPYFDAGLELGKIQARIAARTPSQKEPIKTTKAPSPISPVGAKTGKLVKSIYDPGISQREYEEIRRKQQQAKASARG